MCEPEPTPTSPPSPSLRTLLRQLWSHLRRRRRRQLAIALGLMLLSSLAEVVSLAAVLPFLAVLANPTTILNQPLVLHRANQLGVGSEQQLLLLITLAFAVAAVGAGGIRLLTLWVNVRLAAAIGSDLSCEAYRRTLYQPYAVHIARNSSDMIASISTDVGAVITNVLNPLLVLTSSALIVLALIGTLLVINWLIALGAGLGVGLVYLLAMACSRKPLQQLGQRQVFLNRQLIQSLQEGLGAFRDVLLDDSQCFYANAYREADRPLRRAQAQSSVLSSYPRLVLEPAGIVLIAMTGYQLAITGNVASALPLLGALALGAQRLLPMAQKVYEGWAQSRNAKHSLAKVLELLAQPLPEHSQMSSPEPLRFRQSIRLENVTFRYRSELPEVLSRVNLEIRRGERIGVIGTTGSGKSTLADLLMGLIEPTHGRILIDGEDLHHPLHPERRAGWRLVIAHVPQTIYLADSSIAENIAFGIPKEQISLERVRRAAEQAQLAGFIDGSPQGYNTFVGERGIRLSGGQRQRIGIARALYKQAQVLMLDEATAALDNSTEEAVIDSVEVLSRDLTVMMIAHRLSTLVRCDRVIELSERSPIRLVPPSELIPTLSLYSRNTL